MFKINPLRNSQPNSPSSAPIRRTQPNLPFTEEGIRTRAQQVYERRRVQGFKGTPEEDWQQAIRELKWERSPLGKFYQWTGLGQKKGWDLFTSISLPIVLFAGGSLFTYWNNQQQQKIAVENRRQDLQLADDNRKQETLNNYLSQMAESLQHGLLKVKPGDDQFIVAQSRTVLALQSLDKKRQHLVIQFLQAMGFNNVGKQQPLGKDGKVYLMPGEKVLLYQAQLSKANLVNSDLSGAMLINVNLEFANLSCQTLESRDPSQCSDWSDANLRAANLKGANLQGANLFNAKLSDAKLRGANLQGVNLRSALLESNNIEHANFTDADLEGALIITTDLSQAVGLTPQQLKGSRKPFLCNVGQPKGFTVEQDRDCDLMPQLLFQRYRDKFKTLDDAEMAVKTYRHKKWPDPIP